MHQFGGCMDNLANASTNKKAVLERLLTLIQDLTEANVKLAGSNTNFTATNSKLTSDLRKLCEQLNAAIKKLPPGSNTARPEFVPHTRDSPTGWILGAYCFSHGYGLAKDHDSKSCRRRANNHQEGANRCNTMNGLTAHIGWND